MTKIKEIEAEICVLEAEIDKLRQDQRELQQSVPVAVGNEPGEVAIAVKASAVALAERKPQIEGIGQAIALLERQLVTKQITFSQLKADQERQARIERVKVGRVKIHDQVKKIRDLAALLETAFWELKTLRGEFGGDYLALQSNPTGSLAWSPKELIEFGAVQVPVILEQGDRFLVSTHRLDLFEPERQAAQQAQLQKEAENKQRREAERKAWEIQQAAEAKRREAERLQGLLFGKRQELKFFERQVKEFISQGYRKRGSNLRLDDSVLDRLKAEIQELEGQLKQVQE